MYASNKDEDWVYLHGTPPVNTILREAVNFVDRKRCNSSSSSSSITSCSSKSDRSFSLSSISATELEHAQNDDTIINSDALPSSANNPIDHHGQEQENHLLSPQLISTPIVNETEIVSYDNDNPTTETPPTINENDVLNTGFELSKTLSLTNSSSFSAESLSISNDLRRRTGVNVQQTDLYNSEVLQSTPISSDDVKPQKRIERSRNKNDILLSCTCMIVLLTLPFIVGQIVTQWDQSVMQKIVNELDKTNQRLNEIKDMPIGNLEEKLTKQLEEKLQNMISQQLAGHDHEKHAFFLQIQELRQILNMTKQNLTNTIYQLTDDNGRLQGQIKSLEQRLEVAEKRQPKDRKICLEGVNCTNSSQSTLNTLVSNIYKQTASINLSGVFEHLSASVSELVDHRHDYVNKSRRKLVDLTRTSTADKVQTSFRRGVENLSSSFRKAKLTYATWLKSREQIRMDKNKQQQQQQTPVKYPWRWVFQRDYSREQTHYQTSNKEYFCHSNSYFPLNKIRSMKNWMVKVFRA